MLLETKYEFGQIVYVIGKGNIEEARVREVNYNIINAASGIRHAISYDLARTKDNVGLGKYYEKVIFATKEDAILSWLETQGVDMLIIKAKI